jgi:hypothetical protein
MVVLHRALDVQTVVDERVAGRQAEVELAIVAVSRDTTLGQSLDALKVLFGNEEP